jgi:hypothetical protein
MQMVILIFEIVIFLHCYFASPDFLMKKVFNFRKCYLFSIATSFFLQLYTTVQVSTTVYVLLSLQE